jgi:predicted nuclease of predicted toxin-antitoxin system
VSSFLVDECVPRAVHEALSRAGHEVILSRDVLPGANDEDVLAFARGRGLSVLPGILDSLADAVTVVGAASVRRRPL